MNDLSWKGTFKCHLLQLFCNEQGHLQLDSCHLQLLHDFPTCHSTANLFLLLFFFFSILFLYNADIIHFTVAQSNFYMCEDTWTLPAVQMRQTSPSHFNNHKSGQNVLLFLVFICIVTCNRKALLNHRAQLPATAESCAVQLPFNLSSTTSKMGIFLFPLLPRKRCFRIWLL